MYFCSCEYNYFCNYRSSNRISLYDDMYICKFLHNYHHTYNYMFHCMLLRKFWCIVYCIRSNIRFCNYICMMFRYTPSVPLRIVAIVM